MRGGVLVVQRWFTPPWALEHPASVEQADAVTAMIAEHLDPREQP